MINDNSINEELSRLVPYVYAVAFKLTFDVTKAEDLAQETLLSAWEKQDQLADKSKLKSWVRSICVNHHLSNQRRTDSKTLSFEEISALSSDGLSFDPIEDSPTAEDELIAEETFRDIRNGCFSAMARKLSLMQRTTFSLIDMFGLSIEETAQLLTLSVPAVKGLLFRARSHLYNFFDNRCEWISADTACRCSAWFDFSGDRDALREKIKNRKVILQFDDMPEFREHKADIRKKVLTFYLHLPDRTPDSKWYSDLVDILLQKK
ncbi:MAG TPA: RNA polymerase sigma factor [Spirochaetota bacterium]